MDPFNQFPELTTQHLRLRQLRIEDADAIYDYKRRREDGLHVPRVEFHDDISESRDLIGTYLQRYADKAAVYWGITYPPNDVVVGTVGLCSMAYGLSRVCSGKSSVDSPRLTAAHRAEISCALSPDFQGKGIMSEARIAIINYVFGAWPRLERIHSEVSVSNAPSLKMNCNLGFNFEGVLRSYEKAPAGGYCDIQILSLLRSDWKRNPLYRNDGNY
jgi:ribosomal-protein-alanine N-acetyltransferase